MAKYCMFRPIIQSSAGLEVGRLENAGERQAWRHTLFDSVAADTNRRVEQNRDIAVSFRSSLCLQLSLRLCLWRRLGFSSLLGRSELR